MKRTIIELIIVALAGGAWYVNTNHPFATDRDVNRTRHFQEAVAAVQSAQHAADDFVNKEVAACGANKVLQFDNLHILRCADKPK